MLILNTNHADYSLLFTLHSGHQVNSYLKQEYLAVLETNHRTPYYLNLHCKDTAHTVILGRTAPGKVFVKSRPIRKMVGRGGGDRTRKTFEFSMTHDIHGEIGRLWSWC